MILSFKLSMPHVNTWNGKWTGENYPYARIVNYGVTKKGIARAIDIIYSGPYYYNFGDGWTAKIDVEAVTPQQAKMIRKRTMGFCGYDWMIKSIRQDLCIKV